MFLTLAIKPTVIVAMQLRADIKTSIDPED